MASDTKALSKLEAFCHVLYWNADYLLSKHWWWLLNKNAYFEEIGVEPITFASVHRSRGEASLANAAKNCRCQ